MRKTSGYLDYAVTCKIVGTQKGETYSNPLLRCARLVAAYCEAGAPRRGGRADTGCDRRDYLVETRLSSNQSVLAETNEQRERVRVGF